ncbi:MAG: hypothetical protein Q4B31_04270 [Clostridia bacterium]|nr:hypothetical protein [Clostridia bacterium]
MNKTSKPKHRIDYKVGLMPLENVASATEFTGLASVPILDADERYNLSSMFYGFFPEDIVEPEKE